MNPRRIIPNNLGGTDILLDDVPGVGAVEFNDALYAFGPGVIVLLASEQIIPPAYSDISLFLSIGTFILGLSFLILKPDYMTLSGWIKTVRKYRKLDKNIILNLTESDGELVNADRDTREEINIERIYPQEHTIERSDGSLVGIIRIKGLNLYNAPQSEVQREIQAYDNFLNTQLNQDFQLYLPMRRFDPSSKINHLKERLDDEKVATDEFLRTYAEDRMLWLDMVSQQSYTRNYYAVIETSRSEVVSDQYGSESNTAQILRSLGGEGLAKAWIGITGSVTGQLETSRIDDEKFEKHEKKMNDFSDDFERALGTNAEIVNGNQLGVILKEFWEGIEIRDDQTESFVKGSKFVKGNLDKERGEKAYREWEKDVTGVDQTRYGDRL